MFILSTSIAWASFLITWLSGFIKDFQSSFTQTTTTSKDKQLPAEGLTLDISSWKEGKQPKKLGDQSYKAREVTSEKCEMWELTLVVKDIRRPRYLTLDFNNLNNTMKFQVNGSLKFTASFVENSATRKSKKRNTGQNTNLFSWNKLLNSKD